MGMLAFGFDGSAVKYGCWGNKDVKGKGQPATPESWEEMKAQLSQAHKGMCLSFEVKGTGISSPGVMSNEKQVIEGVSAIPYTHGFNIFRDLETLFQLPVTIENDANCAGVAGFYERAARDYQDVAFVVVGTGIGGAMFTEGQINKSTHLYDGELGLMFLEGSQAFSKLGAAIQIAWRYCERRGVDRNTYTRKDVFELAKTGNETAEEEVESFYTYFAKGLFNIQFSFDPEVIVLGSGISAKDGFIDKIQSKTKKSTDQSDLHDFESRILLCEYRNDANLIGAAANYIAIGRGRN